MMPGICTDHNGRSQRKTTRPERPLESAIGDNPIDRLEQAMDTVELVSMWTAQHALLFVVGRLLVQAIID